MSGNVVQMPAPDWRAQLKMNKHGAPSPETGNAFLMLTHGAWTGCLAFDEFGERIYWAKAPPNQRNFTPPKVGDELNDNHIIYVQHYFSRIGMPEVEVAGALFSSETLWEAMRATAHMNKRHPLREYLRGITWDGVERLETWCSKYLGCEQTDYSGNVGRWWMISAVARAFVPGEQVDHMLLLQGKQGVRKSTALRILAGDWYLPELPDVRSKESAHALHGRWIVECGELSVMLRSGMTTNAIKDFLTRCIDVYREPYGRAFVRRPRTAVFAGTTNDEFPFSDPTGARRFWMIKCGNVDASGLRKVRDQLWAEAVAQYDAGEEWYPPDHMRAMLAEQQEEGQQIDPWEERILAWVHRRNGEPFSMTDAMLLALNLDPKDQSRAAETRVGAVLSRHQFVVSRARLPTGVRVRHYALPKPQLALLTDEDPHL